MVLHYSDIIALSVTSYMVWDRVLGVWSQLVLGDSDDRSRGTEFTRAGVRVQSRRGLLSSGLTWRPGHRLEQ